MDAVEIDGLRIAYQRRGDGPPLVLLHGILQDSRAWRRQLDSLSDDFTTVAWDAPGCGRSSDPPETDRMPEYADRLAAFIDAVGLGRPHVVGISLGGALALELYRRHPRIPRSLVLVAAYAGWAGSLPPDVVEERLRQAIVESELTPDRFVRGWLPGLFTDAAPSDRVEEIVAMMSEFHPVGYRVMARAMADADLRDVLPRIEVPTLVLAGAADQRAPLSVATDLHDRIRGSKLIVEPGVGHIINVEAAERFDAIVGNFLRAVDPSP